MSKIGVRSNKSRPETKSSLPSRRSNFTKLRPIGFGLVGESIAKLLPGGVPLTWTPYSLIVLAWPWEHRLDQVSICGGSSTRKYVKTQPDHLTRLGIREKSLFVTAVQFKPPTLYFIIRSLNPDYANWMKRELAHTTWNTLLIYVISGWQVI